MNRRILTAIALLLTAFPAAAAGPRLGLQARAGLNVADFSASAEGLNLSTRLDSCGRGRAAFVRRHRRTARTDVHAQYVEGERPEGQDVQCRTARALHVAPAGAPERVRGPAFALSDSSYYRIDGERREFGNAKPTLTYMAGAAVRLNHLVLDCRFNGAFNKTENYFEGVYPRIKSYQLLFSVGYAF